MGALELAREHEAEACYAVLEAGREFQKRQGFEQWTKTYPTLEIVKDDIRRGRGFVFRQDGAIAGYMCIDFDGEPAYAHIQGQWHTREPYAVVHRMAFAAAFCGRGLSAEAFALIERLCLSRGVHSIRMDTDFPNLRMQHILERQGFVRRGVIDFQGGTKLAYDKTLA